MPCKRGGVAGPTIAPHGVQITTICGESPDLLAIYAETWWAHLHNCRAHSIVERSRAPGNAGEVPLLRILKSIIGILGPSLAVSLLASPAYSASNTDVQWVARWLDDGAGNAATEAVVQAATPKRFFAAGDTCTLLDENNTAGTFGPYSAGNECVLGEGPGRGQDADWDNIIRLAIQTNNPTCNTNDELTFLVGNFELEVDWEYCEFLSLGGQGNNATLYSFPVPQRSAFADGVESVEVFIPNNST